MPKRFGPRFLALALLGAFQSVVDAVATRARVVAASFAHSAGVAGAGLFSPRRRGAMVVAFDGIGKVDVTHGKCKMEAVPIISQR